MRAIIQALSYLPIWWTVCLEEKSSNSEHDFDEKAVENDKDHEDVYRDGDSESYGDADQFQ